MNIEDSYQYQAWIRDQLEPEEKLYVGRKPPREVPQWAMKFPDHLIGRSPEEMTELQKDERNDEYLRKHGIK